MKSGSPITINKRLLRSTILNKRLLLASIRKWEKIVVGKGVDAGRSNCPLCKRYNRFHKHPHPNEIECDGCPIFVSTRCRYCEYTPYSEWCLHQDVVHNCEPPYTVQCPTCKSLAGQELAFLKKVYKELYGTC